MSSQFAGSQTGSMSGRAEMRSPVVPAGIDQTEESMTSIIERRMSALHTAYLDPMTGMGALVLPSPRDDVWLQGTLNGADWDSALGTLLTLGWEPLPDEDECLIEEGQTRQVLPIVALVAAEAVAGLPTLRSWPSLALDSRALCWTGTALACHVAG